VLYAEPSRIACRTVAGDSRAPRGDGRLTGPPAGGTDAELDLTIDPGKAIPRPVRTMLSNVIVRGALKDLQAYVGGRQPA
jgi:hypothetical protein